MLIRNSRAMFRLLQADGNISINKHLIHALGITEAILYCELLSRHSYFEDRGNLQEDGSFFNTIYDLQLGTGIGEKSQRTAIKNLEKLGLLKCKVKGVPARRYFYINFNIDLEEFIIKGEEKIKQIKEIIALKQEKITVQPNGETSSAERSNLMLQEEKLVQPKGSSNNTNFNNTNLNKTNLVVVEAFSKAKNKTITKAEKDKLIELSNNYSEELILKAIDMTVEQAEHFNIKYIRTILESFKAKGLNTLQEVEAWLENDKRAVKKGIENKRNKIKDTSEPKSNNSWYNHKADTDQYTEYIRQLEARQKEEIYE